MKCKVKKVVVKKKLVKLSSFLFFVVVVSNLSPQWNGTVQDSESSSMSQI